LVVLPKSAPHHAEEEFEVKNSQVAVICGVILLAAGIVAWSNVQVSRTLVTLLQRGNGPKQGNMFAFHEQAVNRYWDHRSCVCCTSHKKPVLCGVLAS